MLKHAIIVEINALNYNKILGLYNTNKSHQLLSPLSFNLIAVYFWKQGLPSKSAKEFVNYRRFPHVDSIYPGTCNVSTTMPRFPQSYR